MSPIRDKDGLRTYEYEAINDRLMVERGRLATGERYGTDAPLSAAPVGKRRPQGEPAIALRD